MRYKRKAHQVIDRMYLLNRKNGLIKAGYQVPKWILFCEWAIGVGLRVFLHEAQTTVSKYIYVSVKPGGPEFKVRFSNHKPNKQKENAEDCDFFVGVSHNKVTNTGDAIAAVMQWAAKEHHDAIKG